VTCILTFAIVCSKNKVASHTHVSVLKILFCVPVVMLLQFQSNGGNKGRTFVTLLNDINENLQWRDLILVISNA
jgi:hypothetical protein